MSPWIAYHLAWITAASLLVSLCATLAAMIIVIRLPHDYFLHDAPQRIIVSHSHPRLRILLITLKNAAGLLLLLLGLLLSLPLVPGPGLLLLLVGVGMTDIPGKFALERFLLRKPFVLDSINSLRAWWKRPPLEIGPPSPSLTTHRRPV